MQFLSLSRRRTDAFPPEAFTKELAARETMRVKELYASGLLRQLWKRGDIPGAAILWEAASEAEIRAALDSLPLFQAGMLEIVAIVPLEPYPGFGPAQSTVIERSRFLSRVIHRPLKPFQRRTLLFCSVLLFGARIV